MRRVDGEDYGFRLFFSFLGDNAARYSNATGSLA